MKWTWGGLLSLVTTLSAREHLKAEPEPGPDGPAVVSRLLPAMDGIKSSVHKNCWNGAGNTTSEAPSGVYSQSTAPTAESGQTQAGTFPNIQLS